MLTTREASLDHQFRLLRHQGMSVSDSERHSSAEVLFEEYAVLGYNYRMTDIQAAIGREQLKRLPAMIARRRELAARYHDLLRPLAPDVTIPTESPWARTNWQSYAVRLDARLDSRVVMQFMLDAGVATRRGVMNAHCERAYPEGTWSVSGTLAHSEDAQRSALVIPLFHQLTEREQDQVVQVLADAVCQARIADASPAAAELPQPAVE